MPPVILVTIFDGFGEIKVGLKAARPPEAGFDA
jgi:hypothetical protein